MLCILSLPSYRSARGKQNIFLLAPSVASDFSLGLPCSQTGMFVNGIEGPGRPCTLAMSRMANKPFNFPNLKSCSWKSTASHWNILLQIERVTVMMLRENLWIKVTMSRRTCWKVETTCHSLMNEIRKTWLFTLFLRPSFLNPSL